jgi:hypothetical protein
MRVLSQRSIKDYRSVDGRTWPITPSALHPVQGPLSHYTIGPLTGQCILLVEFIGIGS